MKLIFVYGTLKRNNALHSALENCMFLGEGITLEPTFRLFCNGCYPHAINTGEGGYRISGELYSVPDKVVAELDLIEGHPTSYTRRDVEFMREDGNFVWGQMYVYNNKGACKHYTEVKSGYWTPKNSEISTEKV